MTRSTTRSSNAVVTDVSVVPLTPPRWPDPVDTGGRRIANSDAYTGTLDLFRGAGFRPVAERVRGRPVVELTFG